MDEIAAEAGVARSTVYVYFANRDELLRACLKGMHDQLLEDIAESWEANDEPVHRLERLIEGMLERIDDDPAFFRLALMTQGMVIQGGEAVGTELAIIGLNIARLIRDLYVDGVASGIFRDIDPDEAVNLIGQQIYGAMAVRAGESSPSRRPQPPTDLHLHPPRAGGLTDPVGLRLPPGQPPATAGTIERVWPSATGVARPSRKRTSSSARNTLTNRRSPPLSSKRRSPKPG